MKNIVLHYKFLKLIDIFSLSAYNDNNDEESAPSSKILSAYRWRPINKRPENIARSPEASNKCPA